MFIIYGLAGKIWTSIFMTNSQWFHFPSKAESFTYLIVIASFRFKYGIKVSYIFDTRPICQRVSTIYPPMPRRWMEPSDARKVDRRDERSNRRTRDTPIANPSFTDVLALRSRGYAVAGLEQTGNSSEHSGGPDVEYPVYRQFSEASRSVLTTALGNTDHSSLMMRTSFWGSLSNAENL